MQQFTGADIHSPRCGNRHGNADTAFEALPHFRAIADTYRDGRTRDRDAGAGTHPEA